MNRALMRWAQSQSASLTSCCAFTHQYSFLPHSPNEPRASSFADTHSADAHRFISQEKEKWKTHESGGAIRFEDDPVWDKIYRFVFDTCHAVKSGESEWRHQKTNIEMYKLLMMRAAKEGEWQEDKNDSNNGCK